MYGAKDTAHCFIRTDQVNYGAPMPSNVQLKKWVLFYNLQRPMPVFKMGWQKSPIGQ